MPSHRKAPLKLSLCLSAIAALTGCNDNQSPSDARPDNSAQYKKVIDELTIERDALKHQLADLSRTPSVLMGEVTSALAEGDITRAEKAQAALERRFPSSAEANNGKKAIIAYHEAAKKVAAEELRLAALGFKALPVGSTIKGPAVTVKYGDLSFGARYVVDRYDDSFHYRDADRDSKYALLSMTATAGRGISNPDMHGAALYWADGSSLRKLGDFRIEFTRWESYATYLGNYSDSKNDFAKVQTVPFALGVQISDEEAKKRPLYVVSTKDGCIARGYERFKNPPDYYRGACESLRSTLTLQDFTTTSSNLTVVIRKD